MAIMLRKTAVFIPYFIKHPVCGIPSMSSRWNWHEHKSTNLASNNNKHICTTRVSGASQEPLITLISGCSSGIGLATAALLAKDRQRRFIIYGSILGSLDDHDEDDGSGVETAFREAAGSTLYDTLFPVRMDVTKEEDVAAAVAMVMEKHGRIDIVVNNAGILMKKALETVTMAEAKRLFDINFFGAVRLLREVLPIMKRQQSGRIIINSSRNALEGSPYLNMYTAAKFAVEGLAEETAVIGRFFNIWVSLIQPGAVKTSVLDNMIANNMGNQGSKGISDHPEVHDIDRKLSTYRDHDLQWSQCPAISADEVAEVMLRAATDDRPHFRYQTSPAVEALAARKYRDPTGDEFIEYQVQRLKPFVEGDI